MVATIALIENMSATIDLREYSQRLGREQMSHFLIDALAQPIPPVVWSGGREGGLTQILENNVIHSFDLAQMLGLHLGRVEKRVLIAEKRLITMVGLADSAEVAIGTTDIWLMKALLIGAYNACLEHCGGRMAADSKVHLERLLSGVRFQLTSPMHNAEVPYSSH